MRVVYSFARMLVASWLLMGGVSLQFYPSAAASERNNRWREKQLAALPSEQRAQWVEDRDRDEGKAEAYIRLTGVMLGGFGLAIALREVAYLTGRYSRKQT